MTRPGLLLWTQHSLGLGHLVRSLALAGGLAEEFAVVVVSGGEVPPGLRLPAGVELVQLPPLEGGVDGLLHDRAGDVQRRLDDRRERLVALVEERRPRVVVCELYPFGRKKFAAEVDAFLGAARDLDPPAVCVSSVRDLLVRSRHDQDRHDERASRTANAALDLVLVHADPALARLQESFAPATPLRVPVVHPGFVAPPPPPLPAGARRDELIVSAGGGRVGHDLFIRAIAAHALLPLASRPHLRLIAGPFLPADEFAALAAAVRGRPDATLERSVPDLGAELAGARWSLSQCGYNTALDLIRTRVPALVVPFCAGREDEQARRAAGLAARGVLRVSRARSAAGLAAELRALDDHEPTGGAICCDGASVSLDAITRLLDRQAVPA